MNKTIEEYAIEQMKILEMNEDVIYNAVLHQDIITKDLLPSQDNISIMIHSNIANFIPEYQNYHKHGFFELVYIYKGRATQHSKEGQLTLPTGSLLLMNTNYYHSISIDSNENLVFNILISPEVFKTSFINMISGNDLFYRFFIDDLFSDNKLGDYILFDTATCPRVELLLNELLEEWIQQYDCYQSACTAYLSLIFTELFRTHLANELGPHKKQMEDIIRFINENIDSVTLSSLAEKNHYSVEHMSRVVKSLFGKNFSTLINDIRLDQAVFLMKNSPQSIDFIALQLGFYDRSHFNRLFKKRYGCSPKEYLKL